jgi:hypothetical protein
VEIATRSSGFLYVFASLVLVGAVILGAVSFATAAISSSAYGSSWLLVWCGCFIAVFTTLLAPGGLRRRVLLPMFRSNGGLKVPETSQTGGMDFTDQLLTGTQVRRDIGEYACRAGLALMCGFIVWCCLAFLFLLVPAIVGSVLLQRALGLFVLLGALPVHTTIARILDWPTLRTLARMMKTDGAGK